MHIEIYDYEGSACCTKVRWALAEERLTWTRHRIDLTRFDQKTSEYLQVHPEGLVPAARFDGDVMLDADHIMKHLAHHTGSGRIVPGRLEVQRTISHWLESIERFHLPYGCILYQEVFLPLQHYRSGELRGQYLARIADPKTRGQIEYLIANGFRDDQLRKWESLVAAGLETADTALGENHWLTGNSFTIADIALFPYVNTPMHRVSNMWRDRLPNLTRWLARMRSRAAFIDAVVNYPYNEELWSAVLRAPGGGGFRAI